MPLALNPKRSVTRICKHMNAIPSHHHDAPMLFVQDNKTCTGFADGMLISHFRLPRLTHLDSRREIHFTNDRTSARSSRCAIFAHFLMFAMVLAYVNGCDCTVAGGTLDCDTARVSACDNVLYVIIIHTIKGNQNILQNI